MKLFTKICLMIAAVALGLGVIGVGIGFAMGADMRDLNEMGIYISPHQQVRVTSVKKNMDDVWEESIEDVIEEAIEDKIENRIEDRIEEYSESNIEGIAENHQHDEKEIDALLGNKHHSIEHYDFEEHHNDNLHSYSCSLQDINALKIDADNAKVMVYAVDEAVSINYFSSHKSDISKAAGSVLKIKDENSSQTPTELEIFIPIGMLKEIDIEIEAGELVADKLAAEYISIDMSAGRVQVEELIAGKEAEVQIDAGQVTVGYYEGPKLEVDCAVGSVMVVCEGNQSDYNYKLECGLGKIQMNEESYSGIGNDFRINNESNKLIKAECEMGEVLLEFPNSL